MAGAVPASASRRTRVRRTERIASSSHLVGLTRWTPACPNVEATPATPARAPGSEPSDTRMVAFPLHSPRAAAKSRGHGTGRAGKPPNRSTIEHNYDPSAATTEAGRDGAEQPAPAVTVGMARR